MDRYQFVHRSTEIDMHNFFLRQMLSIYIDKWFTCRCVQSFKRIYSLDSQLLIELIPPSASRPSVETPSLPAYDSTQIKAQERPGLSRAGTLAVTSSVLAIHTHPHHDPVTLSSCLTPYCLLTVLTLRIVQSKQNHKHASHFTYVLPPL